MLDDSLLTGYRRGKAVGPEKAYLSVSTAKLALEDPQKFYLRKVLKLDEPYSLPLAFGTAAHEAMEVFYGGASVEASIHRFIRELRSSFSEVEEPTMRYNPKDPSNPRDKEEFDVTYEEVAEYGSTIIRPVLEMIEECEGVSGPIGIRKGRVELSLGELAEERGMDYARMGAFDPRAGQWKNSMPVAVVAGVPFHGYVDLTGEMDGEPFILDHKFVSRIVSYYPQWRGSGRKAYPPNYDPASDPQLDVYAYATGIERAGFQFVTKYPQYTPPDGALWNTWMDYEQWKAQADVSELMPMSAALHPWGDLHYVSVWRPGASDHPTAPNRFSRQAIMGRTVRFVRSAAELITEGLLLLEAGVDPEIAFPAGDPEEIARKACPFCHFHEQCPTPRDVDGAQAAYEQAWETREELCLTTPEIRERRALWNQ